MIIFFGINWGVLGVVFLIAILGGAFALEKTIAFFLGPIKWIAIAIMIIATIICVWVSFLLSEENRPSSRLVGAILNAIASFARNSINVVFLLCVLVGFLYNMDQGGFYILWAIFAIFSDGLIFAFFFALSIAVDCLVLQFSDERSTILVGGIHFIVSAIFLFVIQGILSGYYGEIVAQIFSGFPRIQKFIVTPWPFLFFA